MSCLFLLCKSLNMYALAETHVACDVTTASPFLRYQVYIPSIMHSNKMIYFHFYLSIYMLYTCTFFILFNCQYTLYTSCTLFRQWQINFRAAMTAPSWGQTLSNDVFVWIFFNFNWLCVNVLTLTAIIYIYIWSLYIYKYCILFRNTEIYKYTVVSEKQRDLSSYQFMHLSIPYTIKNKFKSRIDCFFK